MVESTLQQQQTATIHQEHKQFKFTNRLEKESSPYLLQHQHNPVDWYPWGEEAFEKARRENKPIFLSIGYSTCHWCHVMERESFENEEIAKIMNEHFVNIKVDREERPDIDRVYMTYVQVQTGHGGWPLSVFLTPNLSPIFGGTYFPPTESIYRGGISFPNLLQRIATLWREQGPKLVEQSEKAVSIIKKAFIEKSSREENQAASAEHVFQYAHEYLATCVEDYMSSFDSTYGGFSKAPKFPQPIILDFLLRRYYEEKDEIRKLDMINAVNFTLTKMAKGGIHDQLAGGFHRYSVDNIWLVPHFEKMLYDQGQLAVVYEKKEGAYYCWDYRELTDFLDTMVPSIGAIKPSELFNAMFDVRPDGNIPSGSDPHGELTGLNILHEKLDLHEIITSWNGYMISAFALGSIILNNPTYANIAEKAALFIYEKLYDRDRKILYRSYRKNSQKAIPIEGFLADYSNTIAALLDLYEVTGRTRWLNWAFELQATQDRLFYDAQDGGYYEESGTDKSVLYRLKEFHDAAEPSGNSVSAMNLIRLSDYDLNLSEEYQERFSKLIELNSSYIIEHPHTVPGLMATLGRFVSDHEAKIAFVYDQSVQNLNEVIQYAIHHTAPSQRTFIYVNKDDPECVDLIEKRLPYLKDAKVLDNKTTIYICKGFTCQLPTTNPHDIGKHQPSQ
ncbi:hypothetical protein C9374_006315 [Naegleria lovaniensis]|uniref:Spermatogenesis-associated protein 20-like TRX domain-containing protein n=1 Tax=Naegleria lovaniensis TaxID=51637 RepID=A0AA88GLJ2_NAELO|nr:uncharacterized protein C9374_006315 [Naegleria lovaniensis]KAG2381326.1 hypothetical protein C9374_006315 [Naegleria lovaniensis]